MHPCTPDALPSWPLYHIFGNGTFHNTSGIGGAHDVNALFRFRGVWHLMNQAHSPVGGTGWSHFVSDDMVRWRSLTTSLGPTGWDGSLTVVDGVPTILFDCQSADACRDANALSTTSGDRPVIGVARAANSSDKLLAQWRRDVYNPVVIGGAKNYAGPSNLWRTADEQRWRMVMIAGPNTGLYESRVETLHEWRLVNATFYSARGGGGGLFHPLPPSATSASIYTHYLQTDDPSKGGRGDGRQFFVLGVHDVTRSDGVFWPTSPQLAPLDFSSAHVFATIGTDRDEAQVADEAATRPLPSSPPTQLHVGWIAGGAVNLLSSIREVGFDGARAQLTALPAKAYASLRGAVRTHLSSWTPLPADGSRYQLVAAGADAVDVELSVALPNASGAPVRLTVGALGAVTLRLNVSAATGEQGGGDVTVAMALGAEQYTFPCPVAAGEPLSVRMLVDRIVVEAFVCGGRGVASVAVAKPVAGSRALWLAAPPLEPEASARGDDEAMPVLVRGTVWGMGCGWA